MINDRYKLLKKIGSGRSNVLLCLDIENDDRMLAIKILPSNSNEDEINLFKEEFLTLRRLNHPNIVKADDYYSVVTVGEEELKFNVEIGSKFFTLEYVEGNSLAEQISSIDLELLTEILVQVCYTLFYIHSSNYIFYDLKLENILLTRHEDKLHVKMIDFGLARNVKSKNENYKSGTAEYIAPEILTQGKVDYKIDLYSLGVILYRIIYGRFPITGNTEIEIFKNCLKEEIQFPNVDFPVYIIKVVKKLLNKEPHQRYSSALEILNDIGVTVKAEFLKHWIPPKVLVINNIFLSIKSFLSNAETEDVLIIRGGDGAGKTHIAEEIFYNFDDIVLVDTRHTIGTNQLWRKVLKDICYNELFYSNLSTAQKENLNSLLNKITPATVDELKAFLLQISTIRNFTLILDDFNKYDAISLQFMKDIIPILTVNGNKIIIIEDTNSDLQTDFIPNKEELEILPFSESEVKSLVERTFSSVFPLDEMISMINAYSNLSPGLIIDFIKNLFYLGVLYYDQNKIGINKRSQNLELLKTSQNEIYKSRVNTLNKIEKEFAEYLSMVTIDIPIKLWSKLLDRSESEIEKLLESLQKMQFLNNKMGDEQVFISSGLKKFVYENIVNKNEKHFAIGEVLLPDVNIYDKVEIARHFELSNKHNIAYEVLTAEIEDAEKLYAYSYMESLLRHILELAITEEQRFKIELKLCNTLYKLKNISAALELANQLLKNVTDLEHKNEISVLKAGCLARLGEFKSGIDIYTSLLPSITEDKIRHSILAEIASAQAHLAEFDQAKDRCRTLIEEKNVSPEIAAKALNLMGILEFKQTGNFEMANEYFFQALAVCKKNSLIMTGTEIETNLGNIYSLKGEYKKAEEHWKNALEQNKAIGSLDLEATLMMNYGILNFNELEFEKSIENYKRAATIFRSLGNNINVGLLLSNLGEVYMMGCEYDTALNSFKKAKEIFMEINERDEIDEIYLQIGKLNFILNDKVNLEMTIKEYQNVNKDFEKSENYESNSEFLNILFEFGKCDLAQCYFKTIELREFYHGQNNFGQYIYCNYFAVRILLLQQKYDEALKELNNPEFIAQIENKPLYVIERIYYLGLIASAQKIEGYKSAIDYFEEAHEAIKDKSITELTWKILFALVETYMGRGLFKKANEFIVLCKSLIDHIAINIKDLQQRNAYLTDKVRKTTIEKLEVWENNIR